MNPTRLPMPVPTNTEGWDDLEDDELLSVVGTSYRSDAFADLNNRGVIERFPGPEHFTVNLVPEPENEHDPGAVAVYIGQVHVGYIARAQTDEVHRWLVNNRPFIIVPARVWTMYDGRWRAKIDVTLTTVYDPGMQEVHL